MFTSYTLQLSKELRMRRLLVKLSGLVMSVTKMMIGFCENDKSCYICRTFSKVWKMWDSVNIFAKLRAKNSLLCWSMILKRSSSRIREGFTLFTFVTAAKVGKFHMVNSVTCMNIGTSLEKINMSL